MSRRISNQKLATLLKASHMALHDLAAIVGVSRRELNSYFRGQSRPVLERKLARVMRVSIPDLRDLLGINQTALRRPRAMQCVFVRQKRRKSHAATAAESDLFDEVRANLSRYNEVKTIYRWANGRGRWVNGGAQLSTWSSVQPFIGIAQSVPRSIIVLNRQHEVQVRRIINTPRRRVS